MSTSYYVSVVKGIKIKTPKDFNSWSLRNEDSDEFEIASQQVHYPGGINYGSPKYIVIGESLINFEPRCKANYLEKIKIKDYESSEMDLKVYLSVIKELKDKGYDLDTIETGVFVFTECW